MFIGLYSYDESFRDQLSLCAIDTGAVLSMNFVGNYFLSQSEVFTDCHVSNVSKTSCNIGFSEDSYCVTRMRTLEIRTHIY